MARRKKTNAAAPVAAAPTFSLPISQRGGLILLAIALVTCLVYLPALGGDILWDDAAHIPRAELRSLDGLGKIWSDVRATQQYYPLLFSWFWLQYQMWGEHMRGYHLVNVLLHLGAAFLVFAVLKKLRVPGALLATAIFALHPVHVESVAWITEQKNTLSAVFYLSAMLTYLHFDESRRRSTYVLALLLFFAALLSKTVTVTLPPALLLIFWWSRSRDPEALEGKKGGNYLPAGPDDPPGLSWNRDVRPLLPFFVLSAADGLLTIWVERKIIGAQGVDFDLTLAQRLLLAGRASWFYLEKLLWPVDLMFVYPRWQLDPGQLWQWLFPAAVLAALAALWSVRGKSRASLAATLFFLGTLFPVLGLLNVFYFRYSYVADHFQYLASLGVIVLVSAAIAVCLNRLPQTARAVGNAACVLLVAGLAILGWRQSHVYGGDVVHFYETILAQNPNCELAHYNLGSVFLKSDRPQDAVRQFELALELKPTFGGARNNLGLALVKAGQRQQAVECFETVLREQPDDARAHQNLGDVLLADERLEEAASHLEQALRLGTDQPAEVEASLSSALLRLGRAADAIPHCFESIGLQPSSLQNRLNLMVAFAMTNQFPQRVQATLEALVVARAQQNQAIVDKLEEWLAANGSR